MSEVFIGRQPICDAEVEPVGYEILYRLFGDSAAEITDPDQATAQVVLNTFIEIDLDGVVGARRRAFFNMTPRFLLDECYRSLPQDRVVLEIPQDAEATEALLDAIRSAAEVGYRIALDNFLPTEERMAILPFASYVKIDVSELTEEEIRRAIQDVAHVPAKTIAHRVGTRELFEQARTAGFDLFQGFFFCEPEVISQRAIPVDRLSLLKLVAEIQDPGIHIERVTEIIERNVSLSYRLLRLVNSAMYAFTREIESIRHAIALVGLEKVRSLVSLILLASVDDKPHELIQVALVRAKFCELLATAQGQPRPEVWFSIGLLSVLDAITDRPMAQVLESLRLSREITDALVERAGVAGAALDVAVLCEQGKFECPTVLDFGRTVTQGAYLEAIRWASAVDQEMAA